jgi:hypothetical protein
MTIALVLSARGCLPLTGLRGDMPVAIIQMSDLFMARTQER